MNVRQHILRTASEIAMGRYMRGPDHAAAADEFSQAFDDIMKDDGKQPTAAESKDDATGADAGDGADGAAAEAAAGDGDNGPGDVAGDGEGAADKAADDGADKVADEAAAGAEKEGEAAAAADKDADGVDKSGKPAAESASTADADAVLKKLAKIVADEKSPTDDEAGKAPAEEAQPLYSEDEQKKLDKFMEDWPEVSEAFDLRSRAVVRATLQHAFSEIAKELMPLKSIVEVIAARTHYADLKEHIGAYTDQEREEIITWVGTQPKYLQNGMMSVIEEGTADEVADLVTRYREATGKQSAASQADVTGASGGDTELSKEAKKAAAALAPVGSKRSVVQQTDDKSDYDGAFVKYAEMEV